MLSTNVNHRTEYQPLPYDGIYRYGAAIGRAHSVHITVGRYHTFKAGTLYEYGGMPARYPVPAIVTSIEYVPFYSEVVLWQEHTRSDQDIFNCLEVWG